MRRQAGSEVTEGEPSSPSPHHLHPSSPPDAHIYNRTTSKNTLMRGKVEGREAQAGQQVGSLEVAECSHAGDQSWAHSSQEGVTG